MIGSDIKVLQINLNRNQAATESALQLAVELKIDIIAVQEPWIFSKESTSPRSVQHPGFSQILPISQHRPRTLFYIAKDFKPIVNTAPRSPQDPDVLIVDITEGNSRIQLQNVYNEADQAGNGPDTLTRCIYQQMLYPSSVLIGDFNIHHPWWDPLAKPSQGADVFVDWIEQNELSLVNTPGTGTFFRPHMIRESVLDLTLATDSLASKIKDWQILPDLGSDHYGILFTMEGTQTEKVNDPSQSGRFNTKLANWDLFSSLLQSHCQGSILLNSMEFNNLDLDKIDQAELLEASESPLQELLDKIALELSNLITKAAQCSIPRIKTGARCKPWWSTELKELRKAMMRQQRLAKPTTPGQNWDPAAKQLYLQAKNTYFSEIKRAKQAHWNQFLEKEDSSSIYKALAYTKDRLVDKTPVIQNQTSFTGKCQALRTTLFPTPPETEKLSWENYESKEWDWPKLTKIELANACSAKVKGKTPGPDEITQDIITKAYNAIPEVFFKVYSYLLDSGYHPTCWKQAIGAILKKPKKPDYSEPKAYRVISLLNCLGKISERIFAQRLSFLAETTTLLHHSQIGSRLHKSAIDAALLLANEVEVNKRIKRITTALFLDIKGAFDHVAKNRLLAILQKLGLPISLISWISSFLSKRQLRLAFDGQTEEFSDINTGIPQGSPISPILFLIYIRDLFPGMASSIRVISYMDDIVLLISSTSLKKNIRILEREVKKLYALGAQHAIQFDLDKTELLHFTKSKKAKDFNLQLPNQVIVQPKELVRWLGIWYDSGLTFKQHVSTRVSQARSSFQRLARLANIEKGLSPFAFRQLYLACITNVADYGSPIWWKGQAQFKRPLQALQNLGLRKVLGVFKTAPIIPMEIEAALYPPDIRLDTSNRRYAFRILKLSPSHPINHESTVPGSQLDRLRNSIRSLADIDSLEPIQHFKYPPWKRETPYTVNISKLSKEEATMAHNAEIETKEARAQNQSQDHISIYTDASYIPALETTGIGVALAAYQHTAEGTRLIHQKTANIGPEQLVYNGELEGATLAVEYIASIARQNLKASIYADNQAALFRLKTPSDRPGQSCQIRATRATLQAKEKGTQVEFNWVPGHQDISGNEVADKLAKAATQSDPISNDISLAVLGSRIKSLTTSSWLEQLNKYDSIPNDNTLAYKHRFTLKIKSKIALPSNTRREWASAFFQLKIGHGYLKSYLKRLGHTENDRCRCGTKETAEHLLLGCKLFKEARAKLRMGFKVPLSLPLLLQTSTGIKATLEFIKETGVATRKWHLARKLEEEEEQERWENELEEWTQLRS